MTGPTLTQDERFALGKALYVAIERTQWKDDEHPIIPVVEAIVAARVAEAQAEVDHWKSHAEAWDETGLDRIRAALRPGEGSGQ